MPIERYDSARNRIEQQRWRLLRRGGCRPDAIDILVDLVDARVEPLGQAIELLECLLQAMRRLIVFSLILTFHTPVGAQAKPF